MISVHTRKILALVIALALAAVATSPTSAQAVTTTDKVIVPYDPLVFACNGEDVFLSGEMVILFHTTIDATGGIHAKSSHVFRVRGVGSVTGIQYRGVGADSAQFNIPADGFPQTFTDAHTFNVVSQGPSDNLRFRITFHFTVQGLGDYTAFVDHFSIECVG